MPFLRPQTRQGAPSGLSWQFAIPSPRVVEARAEHWPNAKSVRNRRCRASGAVPSHGTSPARQECISMHFWTRNVPKMYQSATGLALNFLFLGTYGATKKEESGQNPREAAVSGQRPA